MKKLTPRQQEVVDRMQDGWQLRRSLGIYGNTYLVKLQRGLPVDDETVHMSTYLALLRTDIIRVVNKEAYPILEHELTDDT